jgi:hypothetical protein
MLDFLFLYLLFGDCRAVLRQPDLLMHVFLFSYLLFVESFSADLGEHSIVCMTRLKRDVDLRSFQISLSPPLLKGEFKKGNSKTDINSTSSTNPAPILFTIDVVVNLL